MQSLKIKNRNIKEEYLILFIFLIALIPRVITAYSQGWLADEVYHVDKIGSWFLRHLGEYIFQIRHIQHPPSSPYFVNPPFAMWLMTIGMYIAEKFGLEILYGARAINIIFGILTCILVYIFCKKWYSIRVGIMASLILALSPIYIANNSSAYLDTILSFFILLSLYLFFIFLENKSKKYLCLLAIILGISLITKLLVIPLIGLIMIYLLYMSIKNKEDRYTFAIFMIIFILTPIILWSGARDIDHITGVINYASKTNAENYQNMFDDYSGLKIGEKSKGFYYFFMVIGTSVPIIGLLFPIMIIHQLFIGINSLKNKDMKGYMFRHIFMVVCIILSIIFLNYFALLKTTAHRIIFIIPIIIILTIGWLIENITKLKMLEIKNKENYVLSVILLLSILPALIWPPEFYNAYNNFLIGGIQGGDNLYRVGDGEGLEIAGKWINDNTDKNAKIAVVRFGDVLRKYTDRSVIAQPLNRDIDSSLSRGANYLVIHNSHLSGGLKSTINFTELDTEFIVYVKGYPYIYIYNLTEYPYNKSLKSIDIYNISYLNVYSKNKDSKIDLSMNSSKLQIDYKINNGWVSIDKNFSMSDSNNDGINIDIYGDTKKENFSLDLYDSKNKGHLNAHINIDWYGWRRFYFNFSKMRQYGTVNISNIDNLRMSINSNKNIEGTIYVVDVNFIKRLV